MHSLRLREHSYQSRKPRFGIYLLAFCFVFDDNFFFFFSRALFLLLLLVRKFWRAAIQFHLPFQFICTSLGRAQGALSTAQSTAQRPADHAALQHHACSGHRRSSWETCGSRRACPAGKTFTGRILLQMKIYDR